MNDRLCSNCALGLSTALGCVAAFVIPQAREIIDGTHARMNNCRVCEGGESHPPNSGG